MKSRLPDTPRTARHRFVDVDGLKIFYREAGAATSPALFLLHGFSTCPTCSAT